MSRRADYQRAASAAYCVLAKLDVDRFPVRPMDILRKCRHTKLMTFSEASDALQIDEDVLQRMCADADAMTLRCTEGEENRYIVCYRAQGNPTRMNFTLAHELGHIILRHTETTKAEEEEADCFAGHLLCPDFAVEMTGDAEVLARLCYVSKSAAETARKRKILCNEYHVPEKMKRYVERFIGNGARHLLLVANDCE